jgi:CRP/FNR family transcriptional regulator, dissimilatory nitrate respiration regulator
MNHHQFTQTITTNLPDFKSQPLKPKHLLFSQGDPATNFFLILSGSLKLTHLNPDGDQNIIEIINQNELIGTESFDPNSTYKISAQAITQVQYLSLPRLQFLQLLNTDPTLYLYLIKQFRHKLWRSLQANQNLSLKGAQQRVTDYFITHPNQTLTHQEISELLGTTRETVSKISSRLKTN